MRIVLTFMACLGIGLIAFAPGAAEAAQTATRSQTPPLTVYAALPQTSLVRLSDDGSTLAYLRRTGDRSEVIVQTLTGDLVSTVDVSDRKVTGVTWLSPDHVGILSSVYEGGLTIGASEQPQMDIVNVRTRGVARALRTADRAVINATYDYSRGVYRGQPALFVEAITNDRNAYTLDVYRVDMDSGRGVRVAAGERDTTGYLLGQDGEPALRIARDPASGRTRLSVPDGLGWKQIFERTELIDEPSVWGFGPDGDSVMVSVTEDGKDILLELALADGARREGIDLSGTPDNVLYDRRGRLLALGVGGDTVDWVYFEPKIEAAAGVLSQGRANDASYCPPSARTTIRSLPIPLASGRSAIPVPIISMTPRPVGSAWWVGPIQASPTTRSGRSCRSTMRRPTASTSPAT